MTKNNWEHSNKRNLMARHGYTRVKPYGYAKGFTLFSLHPDGCKTLANAVARDREKRKHIPVTLPKLKFMEDQDDERQQGEPTGRKSGQEDRALGAGPEAPSKGRRGVYRR